MKCRVKFLKTAFGVQAGESALVLVCPTLFESHKKIELPSGRAIFLFTDEFEMMDP